jgi:Lon protease-like protein
VVYELPMFPLGSVLFPYAPLPLHVFEPRYRLMTRHVMEGDKEFGVVLIERGHEVGGGDVRSRLGTVARIVQVTEAPDGRYGLLTVGVRRIEVVEWLADDPYPRAAVRALDDLPATAADADARARVGAALTRVVDAARRIDARVEAPPPLDRDPLRASYEAAALAPIGSYDAQRVLAAPDVATRLALLETLLHERAEEFEARFGDDQG